MKLKVISWNLNSIKARKNLLVDLIQHHKPDLVCLQELKCNNESFDELHIDEYGYKCYVHGQKAYNGVAILSKFDAIEVKYDFPGNNFSHQSRFIETLFNIYGRNIRLISLYVPNGGELDSEFYNQKLVFLDKFTKYINSIRSISEDIVIGSDFNVAPFHVDMHEYAIGTRSTCISLEERIQFRKMLNSGFIDNYRIKNKNNKCFSWWDYRGGSFQKNLGLRIDSIISTSAIANYIDEASIDITQRAKEKPSDHAPVIISYNFDTI